MFNRCFAKAFREINQNSILNRIENFQLSSFFLHFNGSSRQEIPNFHKIFQLVFWSQNNF
jgi:hypothetical protein